MAYDQLNVIDERGRGFTALAAGTISGGDLVEWLDNGTGTLGSRNSTYAWNRVSVRTSQTHGTACVGIAVEKATSGNEVAVLTDGIFILPVGSVGPSGGVAIVNAGYGHAMVEPWNAGSAFIVSGNEFPIGRALMKGAALTGFILAKLTI